MATELQTLKMRVPALSDTQLYYQFKNAMDQELLTLVSPHITVDMHWNDIVDMAMKFDEGRKRHNRGYTLKKDYQQNRSNNFKGYGQNNSKPWNNNRNNKTWNNNNRGNNNNRRQNNNWKLKSTYNNNSNK